MPPPLAVKLARLMTVGAAPLLLYGVEGVEECWAELRRSLELAECTPDPRLSPNIPELDELLLLLLLLWEKVRGADAK